MSDVADRARRRGGGGGRAPVVVSVEQALSMAHATLRCVHHGFRVIRVEPTPSPGRTAPGDPNRAIGRPVAGRDRHSYFVAPNAGKESMALNLADPAGRELLQRLVAGLGADVFCTNTLPARHARLGIDYESLRRARGDLVWCCISALGPAWPDVPGYDPMLQALCGYMDLTGHQDGPPLQCGPPIIDLKAGDEAFLQIILALWERERTGRGKRIDVSMAQAAVSWLGTFLPLLDMGSPPAELKRAGNEHRQFIPVNAYPTADGHVFLAIGSDLQWQRLVRTTPFAGLDEPALATNEGRRARRDELHRRVATITRAMTTREVAALLAAAAVPHAPISAIEEVWELPFVSRSRLSTVAPDGRRVRLPPPAVDTPQLDQAGRVLPFAPAYGADSRAVLGEVGLAEREIDDLVAAGVVHCGAEVPA